LSSRSLSVLCDLRPAFDGYYGIPGEARLMFSLMHDLPGIQPTGLINHPSKFLPRTFRRAPSIVDLPPERRAQAYSRLAASMSIPTDRWSQLGETTVNAAKLAWMHMLAKLGVPLSLDWFDGTDFGDFVWQSMFSRSLPPSEFERCRTAEYATLGSPWRALHTTALSPGFQTYASVDTRGYDMLIAQTPWPGIPSPETQLIVRYHDSMPIFLPHTVKQSRLHQFFHMSALKENAKSGTFACVSEFSQRQLLQLFPQLEKRSFVVYDCIADDYFPSSGSSELAASIVSSRIEPSTEPELGNLANRRAFYDAHLPSRDFRFILIVGTLEPRKNHLGLLKAWERLRLMPNRPTAIVCVGSMGWSNSELMSALRRWQMRGELFHLSTVSPSEMRTLYSSAEAVICPSVSEGFDLPSVEALRCGAAVAASDIPTHREILGDAALYFNAYSAEDMAETISRLVGNSEAKQELAEKIKTRAPRFDKSAVKDQWLHVLDRSRAKSSTPG
jgi:glycosyltransferase involved in cell wall biosynthesis